MFVQWIAKDGIGEKHGYLFHKYHEVAFQMGHAHSHPLKLNYSKILSIKYLLIMKRN